MNAKCPFCMEQLKPNNSIKMCDKEVGEIHCCFECSKSLIDPVSAKAELRSWRRLAHEAFDQLWNNKRKKTTARKMTRANAYKLLQQWMGLSSKKDAHIAKFDISDCKLLIRKMAKFALFF